LSKKRFLLALAAVGAFCAGITVASAPSIAGNTEFRLGIYDHDSKLFASRHETNSPDVNLEALFRSPAWLAWAGAPRPRIGATINTGHGTSIGYAGLAWTWDVTDMFFLEGGFGGAVHNGELNNTAKRKRAFGCRANFHENLSAGFRINESNSIMLTVEHMSNASLCDENQGITNIGLRYGISF